MRYRAVLFDFGGTLFPYEGSRPHFDRVLREMAARRAVEKPLNELRRLYRSSLGRVMAAYTERPFYLHREMFSAAHAEFVAALGVDPNPNDPDIADAAQLVLGEAWVRARDEAQEALEALRACDLHLGIVSNIDEDQFRPLWRRVALERWFDAITTSEEARSCKPDARIFRRALAKAGDPPPHTVLFVGDSVEHDVVGANALGLCSVLIGEPPRPVSAERAPRHVIRDLRELPRLVREPTPDPDRIPSDQ